MNVKLAALLAILFGAHIAVAQPLRHAVPEKSSTAARQSVTKSQAKAARMDIVVENFERIDANNDGIVTRRELRAYALSMRRHVPMT